MSVAFKKIFRKNPTDKNMPGKYYPQLVVTGRSADLNDIAYKMKEKSSLTLGDIRSVLTNFVGATKNHVWKRDVNVNKLLKLPIMLRLYQFKGSS